VTSTATSSTSQTTLSAGRVDITPTRPVPLAGFLGVRGAYAGIADPLEANAIVLGSEGRRAAVVSVDTLYVGTLRERVHAHLGAALEPHELFMGASHTHFAPATDPWLERLGPCDEEWLELAGRRIAGLIDSLVSCEATPCAARYREGESSHGINRRRPGWQLRLRPLPHPRRRTGFQPNPHGPTDPSIRVLALCEQDGQTPRAVLWSAACHPVLFPDRDNVSSEFPGVVREALRARWGEDLPVVFLQGFAGDVRPRLVAHAPGWLDRCRDMLSGPQFTSPDREQWQRWAEALAGSVLELWDEPAESVTGALETRRIERDLRELVPRDTSGRSLALQRIGFGSELCIAGVSAEPMTRHVAAVRQLSSTRRTIPVGYIDRTYGYLPTTAMIAEGGYEVDDFRPFFSLAGPTIPDPDAFFEAQLRELFAR
jgi:hypothetical protein